MNYGKFGRGSERHFSFLSGERVSLYSVKSEGGK